jgi:hypothetical protein
VRWLRRVADVCCNHPINVYKQSGLCLACIGTHKRSLKHRASPVLFALVRGCLHNCAATSVSPAPLLNGSTRARGQASWPSVAGGGFANYWWHSLPWCPGTLSRGVGCRDVVPQFAAPMANPNASRATAWWRSRRGWGRRRGRRVEGAEEQWEGVLIEGQ